MNWNHIVGEGYHKSVLFSSYLIMKVRPNSIDTSHHMLFACAQQEWMIDNALGRYSLRWGVEHGLAVKQIEGIIDILKDISFLRAFHHRYPVHLLVTYWHITSPKEDGSVYKKEIESHLGQVMNLRNAQEIESIINLFHASSWNKQGSLYIEQILTWVAPLQKKHPKIISSLKMKKGHFLLAAGDVMESVSGFIEATDVLTKRKSKSATYIQQLFQRVQKAISRGSNIGKSDIQEMWDDINKTLPIHDRNRFSIQLMVVEYMFEGIDAQIDYIEQLRERLPLIDDPKAKSGYKDILEQHLEEKCFYLLFKNKRYKEALKSGNILMGQLKNLSLSQKVKLLCTIGLCYVQLKQLSAAMILYQQLKEVWLPRFRADRNLFQKWHEFLEGLGKASARMFQKKKKWKEALEWAIVEVESTLWNVKYIQESATSMGLPLNGNKQNLYAIAVYQRANIYKNMKEYSLSKADYCTSIQALEDLHSYGKSIHRKNLSLAWHMLGVLCELEKNTAQALSAYQEALLIRSALRQERRDMQEHWLKSAKKVSSIQWSRYLSAKEEYIDTLPSLLSLRKELHAITGMNAHHYAIVLVLNAIGCSYLDKEHWTKARSYFERAHSHMEQLCRLEPTKELYERGHQKMVLRRALCYAQLDEQQEAISLLGTIGYVPTESELVPQIESWIG